VELAWWPVWPEIVDAADWLRVELGVSTLLWGEACIAMGRQQAAIAIAIVSTKPAGHFRSTPGGYFHGMVAKAKAGDLKLGAIAADGVGPLRAIADQPVTYLDQHQGRLLLRPMCFDPSGRGWAF
jgi:hypothetical protein